MIQATHCIVHIMILRGDIRWMQFRQTWIVGNPIRKTILVAGQNVL